jgi:hypothetical protein
VGRSYRLSDGSTLFQLGSPCQPLCAMAPPSARGLADFIEREFCGEGRPNYLFFRGPLSMAGDHPQVLVETMDQYSTCPPGMMN